MRTLVAAAVACLSIIGLSNAADAHASIKKTISIPAQNLSTALQSFVQERKLYLIYAHADVSSFRTMGAFGELTQDEVLRNLLRDTGLTFQYSDENTVSILPLATMPASSTKSSMAGGVDALRVAQSSAASPSRGEGAPKGADEEVSQGARLEEVVVTATKREERAQDVPMSIAVIGNQEIERRGLISMADYLRTVPGVSLTATGAGNNSIIMRGVSASPQTFDRGAKATVGYYLNDIPLAGYTFRGGADVKLVDLERVEVIRGPQGTLYGSGSLGGTVRNIANPPALGQFEGSVKAGYSHTQRAGSDNSFLEGVVNLPVVVDKLAVRVVGYRFDNSGYVDNIAGSNPATLARAATYGVSDLAKDEKGVGGDEYLGGRISLLFQPTDNWKATLTHLRQDITQHGLPDSEPSRPGSYQQARLQLLEIPGIVAAGDERLEDNLRVSNATIEYQFDWGSLLSSSSLIREDYLEKRDVGVFFAGMPPVHQNNPGETEGFTQEIRFTSNFRGPIQVLAGLYYDDVQRDFLSGNYYGGRNLSANPFSQVILINDLTENSIRQKAAFGEVSYEWKRLELTMGGRGFSYDDATIITRGGGALSPAGITRLQGKNDGSTVKANLTYKPSGQALLYGQFSQGFRLGSPVAAAAPACDLNSDGLIDGTNISAAARTLDPDSLDSYELGTKLTLMGNSLVVNAAAFRNTWKGLPVRVVIACGLGADANAGEARTQGIEFSSDYSITKNLRLSLGASYVDAELTKDAPAIRALAGDRLPGSPKYTLNMGTQYEFDMFGRPAYVRADYAKVGGFYNNLKQVGLQAGNYGLLNIGAGITLDRIGFDLLVKNATNSAELTWADTAFTGSIARVYRLRPRTIGVNAHFSF